MRAAPGNLGSRPKEPGKSPRRLRLRVRMPAIPARARSLAQGLREMAVSWPEPHHRPRHLRQAGRRPRREDRPLRPTSMASRQDRLRSDPKQRRPFRLATIVHLGSGASDACSASEHARRGNVDKKPYGAGERWGRGDGTWRREPSFPRQWPRWCLGNVGRQWLRDRDERQGASRAGDRRSGHEHRQWSLGDGPIGIRNQSGCHASAVTWCRDQKCSSWGVAGLASCLMMSGT